MRRVAPFAVVAVLVAFAYPPVRAQEERPLRPAFGGPADGAIVEGEPGDAPDPKPLPDVQPGRPNPDAGGAIVIEEPKAAAWEFQFVPGQARGPEDFERLQKSLDRLGAEGFDYAGPIGDGAVFKRARR